MPPELFRYSWERERQALDLVPPFLEELAGDDPMLLLKHLLPDGPDNFPAVPGRVGRPSRSALTLYYLLMHHRRHQPAFFPAHDICLIMANAVASRVKKQTPIILLDWELLPVAVLLASRGWRTRLPRDAAGETEWLEERLEKLLPGRMERQAGELPDGGFLLGQNPALHCQNDAAFLEKAAAAAGGVFLAGWEFLGTKIHGYLRGLWLERAGLSAVLQLPRPRREGMSFYPALLFLEREKKAAVRLALVEETGVGSGGLDQEGALALLRGEAKKDAAIDVPREDFAKNGLFTLTPAEWLNRASAPPPSIRRPALRDCAQILRCQLAREKLDMTLFDFTRCEGLHWGETPEGFIAREVALGDLEPMSGILREDSGSVVRLALKRLSSKGKYLLRQGDILFSFRGAQGSLGRVGFVEEEPRIPTITGPSLCVIRPLPAISGVWLYWYLQWPSVRKAIAAKGTGASMLTINIEEIRSFSLALPRRDEEVRIRAHHVRLASLASRARKLREETREARERMASCLSYLEEPDED